MELTGLDDKFDSIMTLRDDTAGWREQLAGRWGRLQKRDGCCVLTLQDTGPQLVFCFLCESLQRWRCCSRQG